MTPGIVIGLVALGAGWVALHSNRADVAVAQTTAPTVATDPKDVSNDFAANAIAQANTLAGQGFQTPELGQSDPSTSPTVSSHLAGLGVSPVKPRPEEESKPCGSSDCEFGGTSGPGSMTAPAPTPEQHSATGALAMTNVSSIPQSQVLSWMAYGQAQEVTAKEEGALMESNGPSAGMVW